MKNPHTDAMDDTPEIPQKEQVVLPPELEKAMTGARDRVTAEAKLPETDILERTAGLGFVASMKEAITPHTKKMKEVAFKDLKAMIMATISLVPLMSTGASVARAAEKATRLEAKQLQLATKAEKVAQKASRSGALVTKEIAAADTAVWKAGVKAREAFEALVSKFSLSELNQYKHLLAKGADPRVAARIAMLPVERAALFEKEVSAGVEMAKAFEHASKGIDTTTKWAPFGEKLIFGKKMEIPAGKIKYGARVGAEHVAEGWVHKTLHTLDPYPDVPGLASLVGFLDLIPGVVGMELVPAGWQMIANKIQMGKEQLGMASDVSKVILNKLGVKFNKLKEPHVARAAEVFMPQAAQAAI